MITYISITRAPSLVNNVYKNNPYATVRLIITLTAGLTTAYSYAKCMEAYVAIISAQKIMNSSEKSYTKLSEALYPSVSPYSRYEKQQNFEIRNNI